MPVKPKGRGKVYVVDDEAAVRDSLETLMRSVGLGVETFASAAEYLAVRVKHPACLVLDVRMPEMDGCELQKRIAGTDSDIPVVVITGDANEETRRSALEAGAVAFFHKPFDDEALLDAIYRALALTHE